MDKELESMFARAEELLEELEEEYNNYLHTKKVSRRARNLTHEVLEKLKDALEHTLRKAWEKFIAPNLSDEDKQKARIYFPAENDLNSFRSKLGRAKITDSDETHKNLYDFLLEKQPFSSRDNKWLRLLKEISDEGRHIRLVRQESIVNPRITVSRPGGNRVSYDLSKVRFGSRGKVKIFGAEVEPQTQRIIPTPGVTEKVEILVSFDLEGYGVNAFGFCKEACQKARNLVEEMVSTFEL